MIKINGMVVEQNHFPDHTLLIKATPKTNEAYHIIDWKYENDAELFTLICLRKHYGGRAVLWMSYCPHARMDRVKDVNDVFTLKYFAEVINSLNFEQVNILDPHSNVCTALINNVRVISPKGYIIDAIEKCQPNLIFYPDEGAMKRYSDMTSMPYAFGIKKREWATGKILGLDIMNAELVKDKNVLIIDDICSRGGTFLHSAKALKAAGANRIFLYVTHAEKTMVEGEMYNNLDLVERIYTTDSIFNIEWDNRNKVTIVNEF